VISIVMPAHDEAPFIASAVRDVADGMRSRGPFEIIVVENGSTDATAEVAKALAEDIPELKVLSLGAADYGKALRMGFLNASGELAAFFDVDYYDLGFLDQAVALVRDGAGIVVGTKRAEGSEDTRPIPRRLVTWAFSTLLRVGFGLRASDTHGMKAMDRVRLEPLAKQCRLGTDLFDTELVLRAERAGLVVAEVPVRVEERRPARSPIARRVARTLVGLRKLRLALREE
jgi:glycosyltransferase involved in cell wall biosynthesis